MAQRFPGFTRKGLLAVGLFAAISLVGALGSGLDVLPDDPPPAAETPARFERTVDFSRIQRGNLHAHSHRSDGDSAPEDVYRWYRRHGYQFAVITDHNHRVDPKVFSWVARPDFAIVPGEEVTLTIAGKPVHVNALCSTATIGGKSFGDVREGLAWAVDRIRAQGAIALVNHPNFAWALDRDDVASAHGARLLEIMNGHSHVPWRGDANRPSEEAIWTSLLDAGRDVAAVAVDDAHRFQEPSKAPPARPGTGWVGVFAEEPTVAAICDALGRGDLYASSGPRLKRLVVDEARMEVWVDPGARVEFVGATGALLATLDPDEEGRAVYELGGKERYVRARVIDGQGGTAWTQAYRVVR